MVQHVSMAISLFKHQVICLFIAQCTVAKVDEQTAKGLFYFQCILCRNTDSLVIGISLFLH
jgi:hypothetical protein